MDRRVGVKIDILEVVVVSWLCSVWMEEEKVVVVVVVAGGWWCSRTNKPLFFLSFNLHFTTFLVHSMYPYLFCALLATPEFFQKA